MSHAVFLSYSRADFALVRLVARALESRGYSVWWDLKLPSDTAETFAERIFAAIDAARSVLVLWSTTSIRSRWVLREAAAAHRQGKLVQANIAEVVLPKKYRSFHCSNLLEWQGDPESRSFDQILSAVSYKRKSGTLPSEGNWSSNYYRPPEDVAVFGYEFSPQTFSDLRSQLRTGEVLMGLVRDPAREHWNSAKHIGCERTLVELEEDHGTRLHLYSVQLCKLHGSFDYEPQ
ncbi:hypothetical protein GPROT2_03585 [Gammaproteobacteria bacterium]|nr:hypothetical protein GPROT2_03585 [Gammaproteobacteria bacterium]